jgi:phosphatidylglycerophosphate synthase
MLLGGYVLFDKLFSKLPTEWLLILIRAIAISILVLEQLSALKLSQELRLLIAIIIISSDIFDGIISRRKENNASKLLFRICDTFVDKLGIFILFILLAVNKRISLLLFSCIIIYNLLMIFIPVLFKFYKQLNLIQANLFSRVVAFYTGILYLLSAETKQNLSLIYVIIYIFLVVLSFLSHYRKIEVETNE